MTYPAAGAGVVNGPYGPSTPSGATSGAASPFGALIDGIGENISQQGRAYISYAAAVVLAGVNPKDFQYYSGTNGPNG
jgi:hypothetical protein